MASTWSDLKIQLMGAGDESGTWGIVTNANLGTAIEEAIAGTADVSFSSADVTLTLTDTTSTQTARNMRLNLTGTSGGARILEVPAIEKMYVVNNGLADQVTVQNATGSNVVVPAGKTMFVFNTGSNVVDAVTYLTSLTLGSALPVASGGTGLNTVGTAGNALVSNGSAWVSSAVTGIVPSGGIIMWSGSIASIPAGWYLCNGSNGTPDLRNKFVIAAYQDNGGVAVTTVTGSNTTTGGSANATLVSHTHTATVTDPGHNHTYTIYNSKNNGTGSTSSVVWADNSTANTGSAVTGISVSNSTEGSSATNANLPPYYALAYIMKA